MANAFQDQLLKAGLVSKDKVNKANKSKHKQAKQQPNNSTTDDDKRKREIRQAELEKAASDRELNRRKVDADNKKAIAAQIRQLIELNHIPDDDGDTVFNFADGNKIKRIYVTNETRKQLVYGQLAIVRLGEKYEVVPKKVAEKIMQRDESVVVLCNEATQDSEEVDEYADYKVPDDLMW